MATVRPRRDGDRPEVWALPKGLIDRGERGAETAVREVLEETAHRFEPTGLVGIYRWHYARKDVTFLRFCFRGRIEGVEDRKLDRGITGLHWLSREELLARRAQHRSPLGTSTTSTPAWTNSRRGSALTPSSRSAWQASW